MEWQLEVDSAREQMALAARPADRELTEMIKELNRLTVARRRKPKDELAYEQLRDLVAQCLSEEGPRYYVDDDGRKQYAYAVTPEPIEVNMAELTAAFWEGKLTEETMDKIAPRRINTPEFKRAVDTGVVDQDLLVRSTKFRKGTPFVKYSVAD
jgi:hypothetical protein